jgi:hypothetical protein
MPLDGSIHLAAGRARVAVYTNRTPVAFLALVAGALALASIIWAVQEPGWWNAGMAVLACATVTWCYRRAERAIPKVVADALDALGTVQAGPRARSAN